MMAVPASLGDDACVSTVVNEMQQPGYDLRGARVSSPTSIKQVAARAGVSVGTVSHVLNHPDLVAETTRKKVLAAATELRYVRNEPARLLRAGRSSLIGLIVLDVSNPFFTDVARGAEEIADAAGLTVFIANSADDVARQHRYLDVLEEQRVRGVLITPVEDADSVAADLRHRRMAFVLLDRVAHGKAHCSVSVDDVYGGRLAATHLLSSGHRQIAFAGARIGVQQVVDRQAGAEHAVRNVAHASLTVLAEAELNVVGGVEAARQLLAISKRRRPTAVVCANDLVALGVMQHLVRSGMRIPDDVAVVGYDDIEFAASASTALTSVRQPRDQLGSRAMQLLLEETDSTATHRHQQLQFTPELVVRGSA